MPQQLHQHRVEVLRRIAAAPRLFCFLDYDGTLSPIAPTPGEALPLPGTAELLGRLTHAPHTAVAVVTGRAIADIRCFIDVTGVYYVGIHGLEVQRPGEAVQVSARADEVRLLIPEVRKQLEAIAGNLKGVWLEDKGVAIACHYRLASRTDARAAREAVVALVGSYQNRGAPLTFIDGHEVTEIRPAGVNKGEAVTALLSAHGAELALYIGDDRTDEEAFERLPPDAITVRVGKMGQETSAGYVVSDPAEVQAFLHDVVACRNG